MDSNKKQIIEPVNFNMLPYKHKPIESDSKSSASKAISQSEIIGGSHCSADDFYVLIRNSA